MVPKMRIFPGKIGRYLRTNLTKSASYAIILPVFTERIENMSSQNTNAQVFVTSKSLSTTSDKIAESNSDLEKIFLHSFEFQKRRRGIAGAARYVEKKLDLIANSDEARIRSRETFDVIRAICSAAFKIGLPVGTDALGFVQDSAEQYGATELASYMQAQSQSFKKQQTSFWGRIGQEVYRLFLPVHQ